MVTTDTDEERELTFPEYIAVALQEINDRDASDWARLEFWQASVMEVLYLLVMKRKPSEEVITWLTGAEAERQQRASDYAREHGLKK